MHFPRIATLSALLLVVVSQELKIPQVDFVVDKTLKHLDGYVHYEGNDTVTVSKRQAAPYWYEEIVHKGISAYGPSGYEVYRNVKDYGAKGDYFSTSRDRTIERLTLAQVMELRTTRLLLMQL